MNLLIGLTVALLLRLQRLLDAVQEEGILLDAVSLEVLLEPLKQLLRHLERDGSLVSFHSGFPLMSAPTTVCEFKDGWFKSYTITPEEFGFSRCTRGDLEGGTPEENARITRGILQGEKGHKRNAVLLNAGAGLYIAGRAESVAAGVKLAAKLIDSGKALKTLERFIEVSNRPDAGE